MNPIPAAITASCLPGSRGIARPPPFGRPIQITFSPGWRTLVMGFASLRTGSAWISDGRRGFIGNKIRRIAYNYHDLAVAGSRPRIPDASEEAGAYGGRGAEPG